MTRFNIPIGPNHPLLKEPLSLLLTVEGERILESSLRLGYVHRGIERLCQERTYTQAIHLIERVCGICSHVHSSTYCQAVEALLNIEIPPRAKYIRALLCELERIHSHLLWLGVLAKNIGLDTVFMYAWRDREIVLDLLEEISGGRVSHAINIIGGIKTNLDQPLVETIYKQLELLEPKLEVVLGLFENDPSVRIRTQGVGILTKQEVQRQCVVGPVARASGVDFDLRRDIPREPYNLLDIKVITHKDGDVWARALVRIKEAHESLRLIRQILKIIPDGEIAVRAKRRIPKGEVVSRLEAPRGELFYYIRSDGSDKPARLKIRTPTIPALSLLTDQLRGVNLADAPVILSGIDLCIACADR
ncbi:MAG: nickel-dependent hydrogenase large subunit [Anaerolineaceae bacterium]|nr:nickel-dependent hydrogenase large subunit [Anaerolineaceae bacterium]